MHDIINKNYQKGKNIFGVDIILVKYKNKKLEKLCHDYKQAQKELNSIVAEKLHALINLLESAEKLQDIHRVYNATKIALVWEVSNHYE